MQAVFDDCVGDDKRFRFVRHEQTIPLFSHWDWLVREECRSDYVIILPDDELLLDFDYFSFAINALDSNPSVLFCFADYFEIDPNDSVIREINQPYPCQLPGTELLDFILKEDFQLGRLGVPLLTSVFRRTGYYQCGGFDLDCLSADLFFWIKLASIGDAIFHNQKVAGYRVHPDNLMKNFKVRERVADSKIRNAVDNFWIEQKVAVPESTKVGLRRRLRKTFKGKLNGAILREIFTPPFSNNIGLLTQLDLPVLMSQVASRARGC